ncbi:ACP S-malonyltransferase [Wolbachia endosymbiont of Howardula sp.]|uniref:ACP S-malonyltransferase n=1 Tax=Wolbachia endosymbiont of Howardula sp. TaxID=2916816 RepID=UPI00217D7668|nr:ACP S-malonyltransferase [Wolbachia endosymbiont of Howardula sp.]UWI83425.1 ACP S-malonyltransferase [Wolbachia endosymbiont of Howardula sp.]
MIFAFPGQGSQFIGMGQSLYTEFPIARQVFDEVDNILNRKLSNIIFHSSLQELTNTENAQPAIMVVSIAMFRTMEYIYGRSLFSNFNIKYVCGHSVGEYTALCASGALTLEDTVKLLQVRSIAMSEASAKAQGGMIALLGVAIEKIEQILKLENMNGILYEISNDNGAGQVVISGTIENLHKLPDILREISIKKLIKLQVSGPFHSSLMKPADNTILEYLHDIKISSPIVPCISNVTAQAENDPHTLKVLLAKQILSRVRWREMVIYMKNHGINTLVEIGPKRVLSHLVKRIDSSIKTINIENVNDMKDFFNELII